MFDGDSFIIASTAGRTIEVRLAGIDAPEKNQPYADQARSALRGLILDRKLRLAVLDVDRYGRKVARAYREADGLDVNAELIRRGQVWVYRRRAYDASLYDLEREARDLSWDCGRCRNPSANLPGAGDSLIRRSTGRQPIRTFRAQPLP